MSNKICVISDTHNYHDQIKINACDILIHCGDATGTGTKKQIVDFAKWFEKQPAKHKIFSPGNHELFFEKSLPDSKLWFKEACPSGTLLIHEYIELDGLKIFCSPYTPTFFNWAFMKNRGDEILKYWKTIPEGLDILITHGMPYQILDDVLNWNDITSVGCIDLRAELERIRPRVFAGGHLHTCGGKSMKVGNTTYYNAAVCTEEYKPLNKIIEFELEALIENDRELRACED
jgi:Icc-related predicted phosphoesterase